jgi:hypothetical protein
MTDREEIRRYNYDSFIPANFEPWMRFHESPPLSDEGPDFPLWDLDGVETSLSDQWGAQRYLVAEFGSFT